jgi:hypothetical protein
VIDSIKNINLNFYQQFLGRGVGEDFESNVVSITDVDDAELFTTEFRFFKKSSVDFTEEDFEHYPVLSVENFIPKPREGYNNRYKSRLVDERDTTNDNEIDTVTEVSSGILLDCRFEVSIATKKESEYNAINDWFFRKFTHTNIGRFIFNYEEIDGTAYGDFVKYSIQAQESPRADGVHETVYTFELRVWADLVATKDYDEVIGTVEIQQSATTPNAQDQDSSNTISQLGIDVIE